MRFAVRQKLLAIKPKVPPHDAVKGYLLRNSVNTIVNRLQAKLPSKTFNFFRQGNLAAAQYNILGMPSKIVYGSSKDIDDAHIKAVFAPLRTVRKFDHVSANKSRDIYVGMKAEGAIERFRDSEAKILEELALRFNRESSGEVYLYTQREPCVGCDYTIIQFLKNFPKINLHIFYDRIYS